MDSGIPYANVVGIRIKDRYGNVYNVESAELVAGVGIKGDFSSGGRRHLSLLSLDASQAASNTVGGLCTTRFWANIIVEKLQDNLMTGGFLRLGNAVCRIEQTGKKCFEECTLHKCGQKCSLADNVIFLSVETAGEITLGK